jgi:hypothetical protein
MGKQSMCVYAGNYAKRLDKNGYLLLTLNSPAGGDSLDEHPQDA